MPRRKPVAHSRCKAPTLRPPYGQRLARWRRIAESKRGASNISTRGMDLAPMPPAQTYRLFWPRARERVEYSAGPSELAHEGSFKKIALAGRTSGSGGTCASADVAKHNAQGVLLFEPGIVDTAIVDVRGAPSGEMHVDCRGIGSEWN